MKIRFSGIAIACLFWIATSTSGADWEKLPPWAASPPWPDKVELASPDPVMGRGKIYETWIYTEAFAKRFSNLPVDQARNDMPPGLQAVAFRIYRKTMGAGWTPTSPLYQCALDTYLDASIAPEDKPVSANRVHSPERIQTGNSLRRLKPIQHADIQSKSKQDALLYGSYLSDSPVTFLDGVLDSRYSLLGAEYRPNALPGINLITMEATNFCTIVWPARPGQRYILSVLGNDPYQEKQIREIARHKGIAAWGDETDKRMLELLRSGAEYTWKPEDTARGLFALPDDFVQRMLKKALAVKTFNRCIEMEEAIEKKTYKKMPMEAQNNIKAGCQSLRESGQVYDAFDQKFSFRDHGERRQKNLNGIQKP